MNHARFVDQALRAKVEEWAKSLPSVDSNVGPLPMDLDFKLGLMAEAALEEQRAKRRARRTARRPS